MSRYLQSPRESRHQIQLFLEETVADLLRREAAADVGCDRYDVRVEREFYLGRPGIHADLRVDAPRRPPLFVEVKEGRSDDYVQASLGRKYADISAIGNANKIMLVTGTASVTDRQRSIAQATLPSGLEAELLGSDELSERIHRSYGVELGKLEALRLHELRGVLDDAKWAEVWDDEFPRHPLQTALLWHLGYDRIRRLRNAGVHSPEGVLPPGYYKDVVVLLADMSGFSSYVRDTRDHSVVRNSLTAFYSNARSVALAHGGLLYMFMGDEAIILFGIPDRPDDLATRAVACADNLIDIGNSVSTEWQRRIDRVQDVSGVHIGMAMGDLEVIPERPLNPARVAAIGDAINLGARLRSRAHNHEILVSNILYQALPPEVRGRFREAPPVDAKNLGRINAWSMDLSHRAAGTDERLPRFETGKFEAGSS